MRSIAMDTEQNKSTDRRFYEEVWSRGNVDFAFRAGEGTGRAEVMADVVFGEDLKGKIYVPPVPYFFVKTADG